MKTMKKILAVLLVAVMLLATVVSISAADNAKIVIQNTATNRTYNVYKVFDATIGANDAVSYYYNGSKFTANDYFDLNATTKCVTVKEAAKKTDDSLTDGALAFLAGLVNGETPAASQKGNGKSLTIDLGTAYGYYYISVVEDAKGEEEPKTAVTVDTTNATATVIDKLATEPTPAPNPDPAPDAPKTGYKFVKTENNKWTDKASYSIGETIDYCITFTAVNSLVVEESGKMTPYALTEYKIEDVANGVNVDWTASAPTVKVNGTAVTAANMTVTATAITLKWVDESNAPLYTSPATVTVEYSAEITGVGACTNSAKLSYKKNGTFVPFVTPDTSNPDTTVTNYVLTVENKDAKTSAAVDGSTYDASVALVVYEDGYKVATAAEKAAPGFKSAQVEGTTAKIYGVGNGTYTFTQDDVPAGYNPLTSTPSQVIADADATLTILHNKGVELPETGSTGTTLLMVIGTVTVLLAGLFLVVNKRMRKEDI